LRPDEENSFRKHAIDGWLLLARQTEVVALNVGCIDSTDLSKPRCRRSTGGKGQANRLDANCGVFVLFKL
jgi:hypothetical protein